MWSGKQRGLGPRCFLCRGGFELKPTLAPPMYLPGRPCVILINDAAGILHMNMDRPSAAPLGREWYLVFSKPRQEKVARNNLARQDYEVFLPLICNRKRQRGVYVGVVEAMFPRYLFIHLNQHSDDWGPIRSTYGVTGLVEFGGEPARVGRELITRLRHHADDDGVHRLPDTEIRPGDRIRIVEGIMAGYDGICRARTGKERVAILLNIAGNCTEINVSVNFLEHTR